MVLWDAAPRMTVLMGTSSDLPKQLTRAVRKIWAMGIKQNDCADEGQQQFTRQTAQSVVSQKFLLGYVWSATCFHSGLLLNLFFNPEDANDMFL
jgi:hypothetical protein